MIDIKKLRLRFKLYQKELALILGVSQKEVGEWERGERVPTIRNQRNIDALKTLSPKFALEELKRVQAWEERKKEMT